MRVSLCNQRSKLATALTKHNHMDLRMPLEMFNNALSKPFADCTKPYEQKASLLNRDWNVVVVLLQLCLFSVAL